MIDLIVEEAGEYLAEMERVALAPIFLAAPTSPDERLEAIATHSKGFVYAISRVGITGTQQSLQPMRQRWSRASGDGRRLPVAVGFGISNAEHVAQVAEFADAAVIGSAIVELIENSTPEDSAGRSGSIYQGPAPARHGGQRWPGTDPKRGNNSRMNKFQLLLLRSNGRAGFFKLESPRGSDA